MAANSLIPMARIERLRTKDLCDIGEVLLELRTFISGQRLVRGRGEGCASVLMLTQSYLELGAIEVGSGLLQRNLFAKSDECSNCGTGRS